MYIYVAGPLTKGDRPLNVHNAIAAGERIRRRGHVPFIPHLFELWAIAMPQNYEFWMQLDLAWLAKCDALVRLPGESEGADREVAFAEKNGITVYFGLDKLMNSVKWGQV